MLAKVDETSKEDLVEALLLLHAEISGDLSALPPEVFYAPQGEHWSPVEHVDHLTRCTEPLIRALKLPRFLLRLRFGQTAGVSRPTEGLVSQYLEKLAAGAGARGRYRPEVPPAEERTEPKRNALLAGFRWLGDAYGRALVSWKEEDLDRYRLPHPLLGPLTVREMLSWSLYHGRHHHRRILERLAECSSPRSEEPVSGPR